MKRILTTIIVWGSIIFSPAHSVCSDIYFINNERALLVYKIINWWYDCIPEECNLLCGSTIRCRNKGDTRLEYDDAEMKLTLNAKDDFAEFLSVFKTCGQCRGPSYLRATLLNKHYFGEGKPIVIQDEQPTISSLTIGNIDNIHYQRIQSIEKMIEFEVTGKIHGLMNGRIALHQSGQLLKTCHLKSENHSDFHPITLRLVNSLTEDVLATYSVVNE